MSEVTQIKKLALENSAIISRITVKRDTLFFSPEERILFPFTVSSGKSVFSSDLYKLPSCDVDLIRVADLFNDRLDYECKHLADVMRLNMDQLHVALKFEFFASEPAQVELQKILRNFGLLREALLLMEKSIPPSSDAQSGLIARFAQR